jgi:hypothetical protein
MQQRYGLRVVAAKIILIMTQQPTYTEKQG